MVVFHKVDFNQAAWRWLFQSVYRVLEISYINFDGNPNLAKATITGLLNNDPKLILLVDTDDVDNTKIKSHCLLRLILEPNETIQVFCEQMVVAETKESGQFVQNCIDYVTDIIAKEFPVAKLSLLTDESKFKALKKKYGFEVSKVFMVKEFKVLSQVE